MGKRFTRIRYGPPEKYSDEDRIGYGEAVSMITDLLRPTYSRRQIENHVRYATRTEKLTRAADGTFKFGDIAGFASQRYSNTQWGKVRMKHSATVEIGCVPAKAEQGAPNVAETDAALINQLRRQRDHAVAHCVRLHQQIERDRRDTELGIAVRAGGRKGGNSPKTFYA